ncbi:MAG: hypothetical protein VYA50_00695 [Chloroflexota bacterium]|nr:hypothetical protein [Chloroflexota bacterium]
MTRHRRSEFVRDRERSASEPEADVGSGGDSGSDREAGADKDTTAA